MTNTVDLKQLIAKKSGKKALKIAIPTGVIAILLIVAMVITPIIGRVDDTPIPLTDLASI